MKTQEEKCIYTVSQITRDIRFFLEEKFGALWIEGEVSNFLRHRSGHIYFSIKDEGSVLLCVFFRGANAGLKFELKNGMRVLCSGKISVYDKRGQYQLYVKKVEPKGRGALQLAFEQLKEKLKEEGFFDESRKKPIPYLPQRIGIITSPTGAAIRDILNVTKRRFANIDIVLNPVSVQGESAKGEISDALDVFNSLGNIDVIILGRGGGSLEDLWPFNEEVVARAIFRSEIPVISAVGHEIDWTISDFVSDFRAPTPSAAAELVIPKKEDLVSRIDALKDRMRLALVSKREALSEKLNMLKNRYAFKEPLNMIARREQEIDDFLREVVLKGDFILKLKTKSLNAVSGKLEALSPLGILNRGYSITMSGRNDMILKDASALKKQDLIKTKLSKGEIVSRVEELK